MKTAAAPSEPPAQPGPYTEADLLALPDEGQGFELINGALVEKQAGFRHGAAQSGLSGLLYPFGRPKGGDDRPGGWWILTETLVRLGPGHTYRPDLSGWLRERLPKPPMEEDPVIAVRPDWTCEILSPKHTATDLVKKRRVYWQHQVPHYWIIDPVGEGLTVHRWTPEGYLEVVSAVRGERVHAEPFGAIEIVLSELFD